LTLVVKSGASRHPPEATKPPPRLFTHRHEHDDRREREEPDGRASRGTIPGDQARKRGEEAAYTPARDDNRDDKSMQNEHRPPRNTM
jgi:hypothetical protein